MKCRIHKLIFDLRKPFNLTWESFNYLHKYYCIIKSGEENICINHHLFFRFPQVLQYNTLKLTHNFGFNEYFSGNTFLIFQKELLRILGNFFYHGFNLIIMQKTFFNSKILCFNQQLIPVGFIEIKNSSFITLAISRNGQISKFSVDKLDRKFPKSFNCKQIVLQSVKRVPTKTGSYFC